METIDVTVLFDANLENAADRKQRSDRLVSWSSRKVRPVGGKRDFFQVYGKIRAVQHHAVKERPHQDDNSVAMSAIRIAKLLAGLPLSIFVSGVRISDPEYCKTIVDYARHLGNIAT